MNCDTDQTGRKNPINQTRMLFDPHEKIRAHYGENGKNGEDVGRFDQAQRDLTRVSEYHKDKSDKKAQNCYNKQAVTNTLSLKRLLLNRSHGNSKSL